MKIIDLGVHPFADTFIPKNRLDESEPIYPLVVHLERDGYIHLSSKTLDRYNLYDYSYTSSNSNFSRNHWKDFADSLFDEGYVDIRSKVLEVGSNDGFLLNIFKNKGCPILGVDASKAMVDLAKLSGVKTLNKVFDFNSSQKIKKTHGLFDILIANNVFNHSNDPNDFAKGAANIIADEGTFIFEQPYWLYTVITGRFDQIYHEHQTYFTVKYAFSLLRRNGMEIVDIKEVDYHGGSIRIYAKKSAQVKKSKLVTEFIKKEEDVGLFKPSTYIKYMTEINTIRYKTLKKIYSLKAKGEHIVGVGAAAKANTFLNFYNLDSKTIDYVTDSSQYKIGKYTPLSRIPIVGDRILAKYKKVNVIILSWNLDLKKSLLRINKNIKFIT